MSSTDDDPAAFDPYDRGGWPGGQILISRDHLAPPVPIAPAELARLRGWLEREGYS